MSDPGQPRDVDRPKLAQALASLKEGLRDTADPFFDGWKKPRAAAAVLDNVAAATRGTPAAVAESDADPPVPTAAAAPALSTDPTAGALPTDPTAPALKTEFPVGPFDLSETPTQARIPPHDEQHAPTLEMAKVLLVPPAELAPAAALAPASRVSLRDTVRIRVVEFPVFPRWAMVAAIGLLLFAASVVALRTAYRSEPQAVILVPRAFAPATGPSQTAAGEPMVERGRAPGAAGSEPVPHTPSHAADTRPAQPRPTARGEATPRSSQASSSKAAPSQESPRSRTARDVSAQGADTKPPAPVFFREPGF